MIKTTIIYLLIRLINGVLGITTIITLTRLLSAEQYGIYALGMAGIGLFSSVFFQWISVSVARFYATHANNPTILLNEAKKLFLVMSLITLLICFIAANLFNTNNAPSFLFYSISIGAISMGLHGLGLQVANASLKPFRYGLLTATRSALSLAIAIILVQTGFGGAGAVLGVAIATFISALLFNSLPINTKNSSRPDIRNTLITYGIPLTITYLATMVLDVSDRFMIGWLIGTDAVAAYAASYDLTQQTIGAFLNVIFLVNYPHITAAWETKGVNGARKAMQPLARSMLLGIPLITGICISGAPEISRLFFTNSSTSEIEFIIPWVSIAIAMSCFKSYFLDVALQLKKSTHIQLRITGLMAVLNIIFNIILIKNFGALGAAISTALVFTIGAIISWWIGKNLGIYTIGINDYIKLIIVLIFVIIGFKIIPQNFVEEKFSIALRLSTAITGYLISVLATDLGSARIIIRTTTIKLLNFKNEKH